MTLHKNAQTGFAAADDYDTYRPSYPQKSVDTLLDGLRIKGKTGATVIDLAAGTGKFTEILAARDEGYSVIAVEPHDEMRGVLEKKQLKNVTVLKGLSTTIPTEGLVADAVIAAQAFHWFANDESLREIHRVLHPHGVFGMIWNIEDYNSSPDHAAATPWEQTVHDFIWSLDDDSSRYRHGQWRKVFDDAQLSSNPLKLLTSTTPLFSLPLAEDFEEWSVPLAEDQVWSRLNTLSQISVLQGEKRDEATKLFKDAVAGEGTERDAQGRVLVHGVTHSAWTSKIPA